MTRKTINKKTNEELLAQSTWFLNYKEISNDKKREILDILQLNKEKINFWKIEDVKKLLWKGNEDIVNLYENEWREYLRKKKKIKSLHIFEDREIDLNFHKICNNIEALKLCWINSTDEFSQLKNIILRWNTDIIKAFKNCTEISAENLSKFSSIIIVRYLLGPFSKPNKTDVIIINIEILTDKYWIKSLPNLFKFLSLIAYGNVNKVEESIATLCEHWINSADDLSKLSDIIRYWNKENIATLCEHWINSTDDLAKLSNIIKYWNKESIATLCEHWINSADDLLLFMYIEDFYDIDEVINNISVIRENINTLNLCWINSVDNFCQLARILTKNIEWKFKENDKKWYGKYIMDIANTWYYVDQKCLIIKKIVGSSFSDAKKYSRIFKEIGISKSNDIKRVKKELVDLILSSGNFEEIGLEIIDIFEKNNLPLTWKIFKVFTLLYPIDKFKETLQPHGSPVLHEYISKWKNVYTLIYKDLMDIAIKSWDSSLRDYLNVFADAEDDLKNFENLLLKWDIQWIEKLWTDVLKNLKFLFNRIRRLYNTYYKRKAWMPDIVFSDWTNENITIPNLINDYNSIKGWFKLKDWESIYQKLEAFARYLWYGSLKSMLNTMDTSKNLANKRWVNTFNESKKNGWKLQFPKHAFLKWMQYDAFVWALDRWITSREYLWWWDDWYAAWSDMTPFDIDWWLVDSFKNGWYWNIHIVIDTDKQSIYNSNNRWLNKSCKGKYELFKTWVHWDEHYWIRTGIPMTEVDYIIYTWDFNWEEFYDICYEITKKWYYIPITDCDWNIIFTPEDFEKNQGSLKVNDILWLKTRESTEFRWKMIENYKFYIDIIIPIIKSLKEKLKGTENEILQEDEDFNHWFNKHTKNVVIRGIFYALMLWIDPLPVIIAWATHDLKHINIPWGWDRKHWPQALPLVDIVIDEYNKIWDEKIDDETRKQIKYAVENHMSDHWEPDSRPISQCLNDADRTRLARRDGYNPKYFSTDACKVIASWKKENFIKYFDNIWIDYDKTSMQ